jgi:hypothetical protein
MILAPDALTEMLLHDALSGASRYRARVLARPEAPSGGGVQQRSRNFTGAP